MNSSKQKAKPKKRAKKAKIVHPRTRATKAEIVRRIDEVYKRILLGAEVPDLCEFATQQGWGLSRAQIRRYYQHALKKYTRQVNKNQHQHFARHLLQRRAIYARAMESGDWRTAFAIVKDEGELLGVYPAAKPQRLSLQAKGELVLNKAADECDYSKLSVQQLQQLDELCDLIRVKPASETHRRPLAELLAEAEAALANVNGSNLEEESGTAAA